MASANVGAAKSADGGSGNLPLHDRRARQSRRRAILAAFGRLSEPRELSRRAHRLDARLHREVADNGSVRSHRAGGPACRGQPPGSPLPGAVRARGCARLVPWCGKHRALLECGRSGGEAQGRADRRARDHRLTEGIDPRTKPLGPTGSHPRIHAPGPRRPGCDPFARTRSAQSSRAYADFTSRSG